MFDVTSPPAIIHPAPLVEVRFGLSYALIDDICRVGYDRFTLPGDSRGRSLAELLSYFPRELRSLPPWMLVAMLPGIGAIAQMSSGSALVKTTVNLTTTSTVNQTYTPVLADWNSAENTVEVGSHGGDGGSGGAGECGPAYTGGGGGSGGKAFKTNLTLTPGGSMTFHLEAHGRGTGT